MIGDDGTLSYYKTTSDASDFQDAPLSSLQCTGALVFLKEEKGGVFRFTVKSAERELKLRAPTSEDYTNWTAALGRIAHVGGSTVLEAHASLVKRLELRAATLHQEHLALQAELDTALASLDLERLQRAAEAPAPSPKQDQSDSGVTERDQTSGSANTRQRVSDVTLKRTLAYDHMKPFRETYDTVELAGCNELHTRVMA